MSSRPIPEGYTIKCFPTKADHEVGKLLWEYYGDPKFICPVEEQLAAETAFATDTSPLGWRIREYSRWFQL